MAGISKKYFKAFVLVTGITLVVASGLEVGFSLRNTWRATSDTQRAEAQAVIAYVDAFLARQIDTARGAANLPWQSGLLGDADRRREYHRLLMILPSAREIRCVKGGHLHLRVSRVAPDLLPTDIVRGTPEDPALLLKNIGVGVFAESGLPFVDVSIPDQDASGCTTLLRLTLRDVVTLIGERTIGKSGSAFLVDQNALLVAHINNSALLANTSLKGNDFIVRSISDTAPHSPMAIARNAEGELAFITSHRISMLPWTIFVEQPITEVLKPVAELILRWLAVLVFGCCLSWFISKRLSAAFAAPVLNLRASAAKMASGDLSTRVQGKSEDEFADLANDFNSMAAQLQDYTQTLEQKVADKTRQLEAANQHKSDFLANMSHELRTPLNAVIGFSDALKEEYFGPLNDKQKEYVQDISGSGQHLLSLINDILDLSKIEAGKMELELSRFDLTAAIDTAMVLVRERALRHGISLRADLAADLGEMWGDERKIKQVLINLLTNAVKFSHLNGGVIVTARRDINAMTISIADTGVGIAAEDQADIFAEFYQVKHGAGAASSAKQEGTGLGLSLAQRFVQLHGGKIWVESTLGEGAKFTFYLPDMGAPSRLETP
jgi:signal transduction histidine kinase